MDFSTTSKLSDPVFEARVNGNTALLQVRIEPCSVKDDIISNISQGALCTATHTLTHSYNVNVGLKANFILFDNVSSWSCNVSSEYPRQQKVS